MANNSVILNLSPDKSLAELTGEVATILTGDELWQMDATRSLAATLAPFYVQRESDVPYEREIAERLIRFVLTDFIANYRYWFPAL